MKGLHQGERLLVLSNRSELSRAEIAEKLNIHPGHLSKLFKSEILTSKIKKMSAALFKVDESYFDQQNFDTETSGSYPLLSEIKPLNEVRLVEEMSATEVIRYLQEKDKRFEEERNKHYEERGRLLAIIENLTKK